MVKNRNEEKAEVQEQQAEVKKSELLSKIRANPWTVSTAVFALATIILLVLSISPSLTGNVISSSSAYEKLVDFLNGKVGGGVTLVSTNDLGSLYEVTVSYKGEEIPVYVTKDGEYFIQGITSLTAQATRQQTQQPQEVQKSDKPKVELFVMTHCPYGTQAEKGLIPVINLLGSSIDAKIRFVHYFMHGEKEEKETYNQVCIREEQPSKYMDYLACFLEDGNTERCLGKVGIDKNKLNTCLSGKAKEYYSQDSALSSQYGVQGSPTLIINRAEASSGRSSQAFLATVCSAFNTPADKCTSALSAANPSVGFGTVADTAGHPSTDTQCA